MLSKQLSQANYRKHLESQLHVYENGKAKEKLNLLLRRVDTEGISNKNWNSMKRRLLSIQESPRQNKKTIFKDNPITSKQCFPITQLLKTSDLDLTSEEKACSSYWNSSSKEKSQKLWLPTKIDSVDLDLKSLSSSSKNMEPFLKSLKIQESKNLFKNLPKTSFQSLQFSPPDSMDQESINYCRKVRIYPTTEQKELFNICIGANRYFYNKANVFVKSEYEKAKTKAYQERQERIDQSNGCIFFCKKQCCKPKVNETHFCKKHQKESGLKIDYSFLKREVIRAAIIVPDKELTAENKWQEDILYDTRQFAIEQLIAAYESNFVLIKNRDNKQFDVKFKKKKSTKEIFWINKKALNIEKLMVFTQRIKGSKHFQGTKGTKSTKSTEGTEGTKSTKDKKRSFRIKPRDIKRFFETDGTVTCVKVKPDKWYLCLPATKDPSKENSNPYNSVFLDPGVRTFQTFYSPDGICGKLGDQYCKDFIKPVTKRIDVLESARSKADNWRTRRNLKNRLYLLRDKIKNKIQDLHWKTCNFLCNGFKTIFLPKFKTSEMVENVPGRVISKQTVRQMLELSHCEFRNKLTYYATTKRVELVLVSEEFTTKCCGQCGTLTNVESAKVYQCKNCDYTIDRDLHGARNICIKALS